MIPKLVHYTFATDNLPDEIRQNMERNKRLCPDYEFIFYDDAACDAFIKQHFPTEIYNSYTKINPVYGAMRADFFRYCVLFIKGGVYIDIKSSFKLNLAYIIKPTDTCILDIPRRLEPWRINAPTFEQWILIFAPNHPYLRKMISLMNSYILTKYIPSFSNKLKRMTSKEIVLNITGPDAFTRAILMHIKKTNRVLYRTIDYHKVFNYCSVPNYKQMYAINGKKHYSEVSAPIYL